MYEKARRGETIELSPRRISIFQFDIERSLNDRSTSFYFDMDEYIIFSFLCVQTTETVRYSGPMFLESYCWKV